MVAVPGLATREEIYQALFDWVSTVQIGGIDVFKTRSRKLKLWGDVPLELRPAIYLAEREQSYQRSAVGIPVRVFTGLFFIYTNAKQATDAVSGSAILNPLVDAVQNVLRATPQTGGKQTLGGVVHDCYIEGDVFFDPGDIDGDGMAIIPVKIVLP